MHFATGLQSHANVKWLKELKGEGGEGEEWAGLSLERQQPDKEGGQGGTSAVGKKTMSLFPALIPEGFI